MRKQWSRNKIYQRKFLFELETVKKQRAKVILELSRNKLRLLPNFPTGHCHLGKHMATIAVKPNSYCIFDGTENKNLEHLSSNCTAITEICTNHVDKDVIDEGQVPSVTASRLLQFLKALRLVGDL